MQNQILCGSWLKNSCLYNCACKIYRFTLVDLQRERKNSVEIEFNFFCLDFPEPKSWMMHDVANAMSSFKIFAYYACCLNL